MHSFGASLCVSISGDWSELETLIKKVQIQSRDYGHVGIISVDLD